MAEYSPSGRQSGTNPLVGVVRISYLANRLDLLWVQNDSLHKVLIVGPRLAAGPCFVAGGADGFEGAVGAFGFAGDADLAAVVDDFVGVGDPVVFGDDLDQVLLDLFRFCSLRQVQSV